MTRAHLVVVVVNEFVAGGWLEFLGSVRLREEERFKAATELARSRTAAAEGAVRADVSRAVVAALGGPAADAVLNELCDVVTRRLERSGRGAADEAAAAVLEWRDETRAAVAAVAAAADADAYGGRGDAPIDALGAAVALALRKREAARVDVAARRAYASWRDGRRAARARAYFADLAPPAVAAFAAKKLVEGYDDADFARGADAVRDVWTAVDAELRERVRNADRPDGDAVYAAAVAAFCAGSPVEAAVEAAARAADRAVADGIVDAAVEAAIAAETGGGSFLGWGGETFAPLKLAGPAATEIRKSVARRHGMLDNPAPAGDARTRAPPGDDVAKAVAKPAWVASVEASAREFRKMWAAAEDATETALAAAAEEFDLDLGAHGDLFDVRGEHNGIYCLLSDNEMTLNARFEQQLFRTPHSKMDVNGSFVRAAFLTLRAPATGRTLHITFDGRKPNRAMVRLSHRAAAAANTTLVRAGQPTYDVEGIKIRVDDKTLTLETSRWGVLVRSTIGYLSLIHI